VTARDHGVDQPIAATGGEVLGAEAGPLPGAQVVGQRQVEGDVLAADPAGLGWVLLRSTACSTASNDLPPGSTAPRR
jgi:hypothetical protein